MRASFVLLSWMVVLAQAPGAPTLYAITGVTIVDVVAGATREDMTIVIRGDRIVSVGERRAVKPPQGASIVDGRGKFLIPGLWDMHVHLFNNMQRVGTDNSDYFFPLLVANGVVGVRDMWSDPEDIRLADRWNRDLSAGRLIAPRVTVSSRILDGEPPTWPNALVVRSGDDGRAAVRSLESTGAGVIKVYWNPSREAYFAIADESKAQQIPFEGHVPDAVSAAEASDAGQRTIEHMTDIMQHCSTKEAEWLKIRQAGAWTPAHGDEMRRTYDQPKCEALVSRLKRNGTWLVPTEVVFSAPATVDLTPRRRFLPSLPSGPVKPPAPRAADGPASQMRRTMRQAGRFLAGTDLSDVRPMNVPGIQPARPAGVVRRARIHARGSAADCHRERGRVSRDAARVRDRRPGQACRPRDAHGESADGRRRGCACDHHAWRPC